MCIRCMHAWWCKQAIHWWNQKTESRYFINKIHNFIYLRLHSSTLFCFHVRRGRSWFRTSKAFVFCTANVLQLWPWLCVLVQALERSTSNSDHVHPSFQPRRLSSPASCSSSLASRSAYSDHLSHRSPWRMALQQPRLPSSWLIGKLEGQTISSPSTSFLSKDKYTSYIRI
jgi:hypothetical protein